MSQIAAWGEHPQRGRLQSRRLKPQLWAARATAGASSPCQALPRSRQLCWHEQGLTGGGARRDLSNPAYSIILCLTGWTSSPKPKMLSTWRSAAEPLRRQRLKRNSREVFILPKALRSHDSSPSRTCLFQAILWVTASNLFRQEPSQL